MSWRSINKHHEEYSLDGRRSATLVDVGAWDKGSAIAIDVWSSFMQFEIQASKN